MANFTLASDLKTDALRLAGEVTDGNSPFDSLAYSYLSSVQSAIVVGGHFGPTPRPLPRPLPIVDWFWARARPRGAFRMERPVNHHQTDTLTVNRDATSATAGASIGSADTYQYWRLLIGNYSQRPLITTHTTTVLTLQVAWTEENQSAVTNWLLYPETYALASDVVRLVGPLVIDVPPYRIDVVDLPFLEDRFPVARIGAGVPEYAAVTASIAGTRRLRFSHYWHNGAVYGPTVEYDYIARPTAFSTGSETPAVPYEHRRVLSFGAAWLIAFEKRDGSTMDTIWSMFVGAYEAMRREQQALETGSAGNFGRIIPRDGVGGRAGNGSDPYGGSSGGSGFGVGGFGL